MSYAIQINVKDLAKPALQAITRSLKPQAINPIIGRAARNTVRNYLFALDAQRPNALGGSRTHFYTGAGRSTQFQVVGSDVVISINSVGIAQRYYGGTIRPVKAKYLTIPVAAEAYGKTAGEFENLEVVFGKNRQPVALATKAGSGKTKGAHASKFGVVLFLLLKSVSQKSDETVLPPEEKLLSDVNDAVTSYVDLAIERAGDGGTP